jgi:rod shape determining protein RodA
MAKRLGRSKRAEILEVQDFDVSTFFSVIFLTIAGFFAIYSATYAAQGDRFSLQLLFGAVGLSVMLAAALIPVRWFSIAAYPIYIISIGLLFYVLFAGVEVSGQRNWIVLGGALRFQPSEFAKLATILAVAKYLSSDRKLTKLSHFTITSLIVLIPTELIRREDPGSATVFIAILGVILLWAGTDLFYLTALAAPVVVAALAIFGTTPLVISVLAFGAVLYLVFRRSLLPTTIVFFVIVAAGFSAETIYNNLPEYQRSRVDVLLDPQKDPLNTGYNMIQTKMAIGSGGVLGKGYLQGTQTRLKFVPKQWTDFIISVPAEEFGLVGALLVLSLFAFLVYRSLAIASSVRSTFASVVAIGITGIWFFHILVNIGMTLGLFPVVGIPLPFMSYGGSALVTNMLMAGILMNLYRNRRVTF